MSNLVKRTVRNGTGKAIGLGAIRLSHAHVRTGEKSGRADNSDKD